MAMPKYRIRIHLRSGNVIEAWTREEQPPGGWTRMDTCDKEGDAYPLFVFNEGSCAEAIQYLPVGHPE